MAIKSNLIADGIVTRIDRRTIPKTDKRDEMTFVSVLIVGDDTLVNATLGRGVKEPTFGEYVRARIEVDVFRDDDQCTLVEYLDSPTAGTAPRAAK